jgi:parallel beta-helix repeat protein
MKIIDDEVSWIMLARNSQSRVLLDLLNLGVTVKYCHFRSKTLLTRCFYLILAGFVLAFPFCTAAQTPISGPINSDTTLSAGVYVVSGTTVATGVTLTLSPGAILKFQPNASLAIFGNLVAVGSEAEPIYFTEIRDDSVGGDTNGDLGATLPAPGSWRSISIANGGTAELVHTQIRYGGNGSSQSSSLNKNGSGSLVITDSLIKDSATRGLNLVETTDAISITRNLFEDNNVGAAAVQTTGPISIFDNDMEGNRFGIYVERSIGTVTVSNNRVSSSDIVGIDLFDLTGPIGVNANELSNNQRGLRIRHSPNLSGITGNSFDPNNVSPVVLDAISSGTVIDADNTLNGPIEVESGNLISNTTWQNDWTYYITQNTFNPTLIVNPGISLTIEPGTVIKFGLDAALSVGGSINAIGTSDQPITFTEIRDDTAGGDSNGDFSATQPSPGLWRGIDIGDNANAAMHHARIRYAGRNSTPAVTKTGAGSFELTSSEITDNDSSALKLDQTEEDISIVGCLLEDNNWYGIEATGTLGVLSFDDNDIAGNQNDNIRVHSPIGPLEITNNRLSDSTHDGIELSDVSGAVEIVGNESKDNQSGLRITGRSLLSGISNNDFGTRNTYSVLLNPTASSSIIELDNVLDGPVAIEEGSMVMNTTWNSNWTYHIIGEPNGTTLTVNPGVHWTIPEGVIIKFGIGAGISVGGTLTATGTPDEPIHFTEIRDDTVGGDSNGDLGLTQPAPGLWRGIDVLDDANATLHYVRVRFAGRNASSALTKWGAGLFDLSDSEVALNEAGGLRLSQTASDITISRNNLHGNGWYGFEANNPEGTLTIVQNILATNGNDNLRIESPEELFSIINNQISDSSQDGIELLNVDAFGEVSGNEIINNSESGLSVRGPNSNPIVARNTFSNNRYGINVVDEANPLIGGSVSSGNDIESNLEFGIRNSSTSIIVDATYNWWGDSSGPFQQTENPSGLGDVVSQNVLFNPYLGASGVNPVPILDFSPSGVIRLSDQEPTASSVLIEITNTGTADLILGGISLDGDGSASFDIQGDGISGGTIAPFQSETAEVVLITTESGSHEATLSLTSNDLDAQSVQRLVVGWIGPIPQVIFKDRFGQQENP